MSAHSLQKALQKEKKKAAFPCTKTATSVQETKHSTDSQFHAERVHLYNLIPFRSAVP